jgi:hypothetical protein
MNEVHSLESTYPFSRPSQRHETEELATLRDRTRYLTRGGLIAWIAAIDSYARGVLGNLLAILPCLFVLGLLIGLLHGHLIAAPFRLTFAIAIAYVCVALFSMASKRNGVEDGFAGRLTTALLVLLLMVAVVELSALVLEVIRKNRLFRDEYSPHVIAVITALAPITGALGQRLLASNTIWRRVILSALAAALFIMMWLLVELVANYIYYAAPPHGVALLYPCVVALGLAVLIIYRACLFSVSSWVHRIRLLVAAVVIGIIAFLISLAVVYDVQIRSKLAGEELGYLLRPLSRLAAGLASQKNGLPQRLSVRADTFSQRKEELDQHSRTDEIDEYSTASRYLSDAIDATTKRSGSLIPFAPEYFRKSADLLEAIETIKSVSPYEKDVLLRALARDGMRRLSLPPRPNAVMENPDRRKAIQVALVEAMAEDAIANQATKSPVAWTHDWTPDEFFAYVDSILPVSAFDQRMASARIPVSLSEEYLGIAGREEEARNFIGQTGPDSVASGPKMFTTIDKGDAQLPRRRAVFRKLVETFGPVNGSDFVKRHKALASVIGIDAPDLEKRLAFRQLPLSLVTEAAFRDFPTGASDIALSHLTERSNAADSIKEGFTDGRPVGWSDEEVSAARNVLVDISLNASHADHESAEFVIGELFKPQVGYFSRKMGESEEVVADRALAILRVAPGSAFRAEEIARIVSGRYVAARSRVADRLIRRMAFGRFGNLEGIDGVQYELFSITKWPKIEFILFMAALTFTFVCAFMDPNATSLHGFYRSRLAYAFNVGSGDSGSSSPMRLSELCQYSAGDCTAPLHLCNAVMNMQGSREARLRDRNSVLFILSPKHVGSDQTGFVRTTDFEAAASSFTAASAMAVSAGALSSNMGRFTSLALRSILTLANVRLGLWVPNPSLLSETQLNAGYPETRSSTYSLADVLKDELREGQKRRDNARRLNISRLNDATTGMDCEAPSVTNQLIGLSLSGGGIRSAAVCLGITQCLERKGLFADIDLMSTVSGGGYTGMSISCAMRGGDSQRIEVGLRRDPSVGALFRPSWIPPFWLLYRELFGFVDARTKWINVSDGGHLENLGVIPLLIRRVQVLIVCDCEADREGSYEGLSQAMRMAELDEGMRIQFSARDLASLRTANALQGLARKHFAVGRIDYPPNAAGNPEEVGYVIYLKTGRLGTEDQVVSSYAQANPEFPHQSTTDQDFDEEQFEAYRRLGENMASNALFSILGPLEDWPATSIGVSRLVNALRDHAPSRGVSVD